MREVKEIRLGRASKDFERWPEESKRIENQRCFVIIYGSEFKLKSLSIAGKIFFLVDEFVGVFGCGVLVGVRIPTGWTPEALQVAKFT